MDAADFALGTDSGGGGMYVFGYAEDTLSLDFFATSSFLSHYSPGGDQTFDYLINFSSNWEKGEYVSVDARFGKSNLR
jgi:hypothetical protein